MEQKIPDYQNLSCQLTISNRISKKFGTSSAILLGWLLDEASSKKDPFTWFNAPADKIMNETPLSIYQLGQAIKLLDDEKFLHRLTRGYPGTRLVKLNFDKIEKEL